MTDLIVVPHAKQWQKLKALVLDSVSSPITKRVYNLGLDEFFAWFALEPRPGFTKATVSAWRVALEARGLGSVSINVRITAVRKLAVEAADNGLLAPELAAGITRVKGAKSVGVRVGNWLSIQQAQKLLNAPDISTKKGLRDRAMLAILLGCGLRRSEVAALTMKHIQQRDNRWCIVDLVGKHGRVRTIPMPTWVKVAIDAWTAATGFTEGPVLRRVSRGNQVHVDGMSEKVVWQLLQGYAATAGVPGIAPHDLRRTCAKLCRAAGGELEQIQLLLGHASVQTTERYLGTKQDLVHAPNDGIKLRVPNLRTFEMTWQAGITDAGVANLRYCDQLESVDLMGSPTGDGAIEALQGKPKLRSFATGRLVTDASLPLLQNFPLLKKWAGEEGGRLLIDGPFTNTGLAGLAGLEGVADLDLFWHVTSITSEALAHLIQMPNLQSLGCDGNLSDDTAMRYIAAIPRLRKLRAQESVATDDGFVALAQSKTLEGFWGRVCPNFGSRGFAAFSKMPSLRSLGVGLKNVDDAALSTLPDFPALRERTPIGLEDDGFRHVGNCARLERLASAKLPYHALAGCGKTPETSYGQGVLNV